jgi:phosphoglycerate kinase
MLKKLSLQDLSLENKKVLLRVDFNVPMNGDQISDDSRIKATLPSIEYILKQQGKLILLSHLGRPGGHKEISLSLKPCAERLSKLLGKNVKFISDCIGPEAQKAVDNLQSGEIVLLENVRFHKGETAPKEEPSFAEKIAKLGDVFVNDAFGASHREQATITEVPKYFPEKAASGFLLEKETAFLGNLTQQPKRPYYAILGGAKASSKIDLIFPLLEKIDGLFLGGAMVFTFFKALGQDVGDSLYEDSEIEKAKEIIKECENRAVKLWLPSDIVITDSLKDGAESKIIPAKDNIPKEWKGVDVGPKTIEDWSVTLQNAATIFWNGPLGIFEIPAYAQGTFSLAEILSKIEANTIVGGGDSIAAIHQKGLSQYFTHLSTGGGASLQFLKDGHLPGIDALTDR